MPEPVQHIGTLLNEEKCSLCQETKLMTTLKKFYGNHNTIVYPYNVAVFRITSEVFATGQP